VSRYIDEQRGRFGVEPICRTLGVSASAYYQRREGEPFRRAVEDERVVGLIGELHATNHYAYGYRRMWKALRRAGEPVARCTVQRLMREQGIQGAKRRGKPWRTTKPDPEAQRRPYLVGRDFSAAVPIGWVADLSYLRCRERLVSPSCSTPSAAEGPHRGARSHVVRDGGPALSSARRLRRRLATAAAPGTREQSHRFRPRPGVRLHGEASPIDPRPPDPEALPRSFAVA
jgi:HTH-like domain